MTTPYLSREIAAAARWLAAHAPARAADLPVRIPDQDLTALEFELISWMREWVPGEHYHSGLSRHSVGGDTLEAEGEAVLEGLGRCLDDVAYVALRSGHVAGRLKSGSGTIVIFDAKEDGP